jgi:hypothetical protein
MPNIFILLVTFVLTIQNSPAHPKNGVPILVEQFQQLENNPWELQKEENGIKIYTRKIDGWSVKEYKVVFYIKTSLAAVENALRDIPNQDKWSKNTIMSKEIKNLSKNDFYTYSQSDSPWPATDRDNIVHIKYSYPSPKDIHVTINSVPSFIPQKKGYVRIPKMKGFWHLQEAENGLIKVTQQAAVDPGGSTPSWLINSFLIDGPLRTMKNFHDYVKKNATKLMQL